MIGGIWMIYQRNRKYPRSYKKAGNCDAKGLLQNNMHAAQEKKDRSIVISMGAAAGILAAAFLNGVVVGCLMKRKIL